MKKLQLATLALSGLMLIMAPSCDLTDDETGKENEPQKQEPQKQDPNNQHEPGKPDTENTNPGNTQAPGQEDPETKQIVSGAKEYNASWIGEEIKISLSNKDCRFEITSGSEWLHHMANKGSETLLYFEADETNVSQKRTAEIKFTLNDNSYSEVVTITQEGVVRTQYVTLISAPSICDAIGTPFQIEIEATRDWSAQAIQGNWYDMSPNHGSSGKHTITVTPKANSGQERNGAIRISSLLTSVTVEFTQQMIPSIDVTSDTEVEKYSEDGYLYVYVTANTDFSITMPDWITGPASAKYTDTKLKFQLKANTSSADRKGTIYLKSPDGTAVKAINVTQKKADADLPVDNSKYNYNNNSASNGNEIVVPQN